MKLRSLFSLFIFTLLLLPTTQIQAEGVTGTSSERAQRKQERIEAQAQQDRFDTKYLDIFDPQLPKLDENADSAEITPKIPSEDYKNPDEKTGFFGGVSNSWNAVTSLGGYNPLSGQDSFGTEMYDLRYRSSDDERVANVVIDKRNICATKNDDGGADFNECKREALVKDTKTTSILAGHEDTIMKGIQGLSASPTDQAKGMSILNGIQALDVFRATSENAHLRDENMKRAHENRIFAHENKLAANAAATRPYEYGGPTSGTVAREHSSAFFKLADNVQATTDDYASSARWGKLGGLMTLGMAYQNWDTAEKMAKAEKERKNINQPLDPSQVQNLPPLPMLTGPANNDVPDLTEEQEEEVLANNYANNGDYGMGSMASQGENNGLSPFEKDREESQRKGTPSHALSTKVDFVSNRGGASGGDEPNMDEALKRLFGEKQKEEEARTVASQGEETKKEGSTLLSPKTNIFKVITLAHQKHMGK